jgi:uncharacterized membrane protein YeaQ/YmgE (transglycosylase-associated protein family)
MDLIAWVALGVLIGWLASMMMGPRSGQGLLSTMLVGVAGAVLGGMMLDPLFGAVPVSPGELTVSTLAMPFVGGVLLVAAVWFYRRNFG